MSIRSSDATAEVDVLVVGEALIDIVETFEAPARGHVGGSPANVAMGLGRLGIGVRLHTALADDARGQRIAAHLRESNVIIEPESWGLAHTSTARARLDAGGAADYEFDIEWRLPSPPSLRTESVAHVGSIAAFMLPGSETVKEFVRSLGAQVTLTFDPNVRPALQGPRRDAVAAFEEIASRADIVKASDEDAAWLYPGFSAEKFARHVLALGSRMVFITSGGDGASGFTSGGRVAIGAPRVNVVDTVGAGDTFMAALIDSVVTTGVNPAYAGLDEVRSMLHHAAAAASITVQRSGADLPRRDEVERAESSFAMGASREALTGRASRARGPG